MVLSSVTLLVLAALIISQLGQSLMANRIKLAFREHNPLLNLLPLKDENNRPPLAPPADKRHFKIGFTRVRLAAQNVDTVSAERSLQASAASLPASKRKYCPMLAIPDDSVLQEYNNNKAQTIREIQDIFGPVTNISLQTNFTSSKGKVYHFGPLFHGIAFDDNGVFRNEDDHWQADDLKERLLKYENQKHFQAEQYCLVYLVTNKSIMNGDAVWNGFSYPNTLCDRDYNVGVVSLHNCQPGNYSKCIQTFGHEFGHSSGADHDEASNSTDGDFMMRPPYQSRNGPNNLKYSLMSATTIADSIEKHWQIGNCFIDEDHITPDCGNLILEPKNEICDDGRGIPSGCCTSKCELYRNAECSPMNHVNCTDQCKWVSSSTVDTNEFPSALLCISIPVIILVAIVLFVCYCLAKRGQRREAHLHGPSFPFQ